MEPNQTSGMPPTQTPPPAPEAPAPATHSSGSIGPIVGAVIIIALLIFGGLYFWGMQLEKKPETLPMILGDEAQADAAPVQQNQDLSTSDEPAAIEQDADDAYLNQLEANLDADLRAIENY